MDIHAAVTYVVQYLQANWDTIGSYLLAGGGISVALQFLKRLRSWESSAWIQFVLGVFSTLTALADYFINNYSTSPIPTVFGDLAPKLLIAAMIMHRIAVNPLTKLVEKRFGGWFQAISDVHAERIANKLATQQTIAPVEVSEEATPPTEVQQFEL